MRHENTCRRDRIRRQKKHSQLWERHMSVGIAAICQENGAGRIVACMDAKVTAGTVSGEQTLKLVSLSPNLKAVFAGNVASARELIQIYRDHFDAIPFDRSNILEQLRVPPVLLKQRKVEAYTQAHLGMSYEQFLKDGKKELDSGIHQRMTRDIYDITTEVELVIFGFDADRPRLYKFACDEAWEEDFFACIGIGAEAATHSLFYRKQTPSVPVAKSLYNVWEAKKRSELAPDVGQQETVAVVYKPDLTFEMVNSNGEKFLNDQYARFGPQPIPSDFLLPEGVMGRVSI